MTPPPPPPSLGARRAGRPLSAPQAMQAVVRTARVLAAAEDEAAVVRVAGDAARRLLGYTSCAIAMRDGDHDFRYRYIGGVGPDAERDLRNRTVSAGAYRALVDAATPIHGVRWVPPGHPVRRRPEVVAALVPTGVSASPGTWTEGSLLIVPMLDGAGVDVGFFTPDDPQSGELPTLAEALLLEALAELTAMGLEAVRSRAAAQRNLAVAEAQRSQLQALLVASVAVRGRGALDDVLQEIAAAMTTAAGFHRAVIYLLDDGADVVRVRASVGLPADDDRRMRTAAVPATDFADLTRPDMRMSRSYLLDHRHFDIPSALRGKLSIPDADPDWVDGQWHALDSLTVPLVDGDGQPLGYISVDEPHSGRLPSLDDIRSLELFADQCAVAVVESRRYERALADAGTDPLTQLPNRRSLFAMASGLLTDGDRSGAPAAVVFFDIDRFKEVNDAHGHAAGDTVIAAVAGAMAGRLRNGDLLGRYGGEEFVAVLPATTLAEAVGVADALRRKVSDLDLAVLDGVGVRVSAGVTVALRGEAVDGVFARADAALLRAKREGRDRVVVAG